jgi:hypothetical protein
LNKESRKAGNFTEWFSGKKMRGRKIISDFVYVVAPTVE